MKIISSAMWWRWPERDDANHCTGVHNRRTGRWHPRGSAAGRRSGVADLGGVPGQGLEELDDVEVVDEGVSHCLEMLFGAGSADVAGYTAALPLVAAPGSVFNYSSDTGPGQGACP
mgnify:CR=1 FL=1